MQQLTKLILNKYISFALLIIIASAIPILSLINMSDIPKLEIQSADKIYHLLAYASLSFTITLHLNNIIKTNISAKHFFLILILTIFFGIIIEVLQEVITTYRTFDYYDIIANSFGSVIGLIIFRTLMQFLNFKK